MIPDTRPKCSEVLLYMVLLEQDILDGGDETQKILPLNISPDPKWFR